MSMNYESYILRLTSFIVKEPSDLDYSVVIPATIDAAEQRVYRELDLLSTVVRDSSTSTVSGNRNFALPTSLGKFVTVQGINVVTPASTSANSGTRNPVLPVDRSYLDSVYNSSSGATTPKNFAMIDQDNIIFGPWPNAAYVVEVIGTIRPTPLSATNTTTFLTNYLPDVFLAASMIYFSRSVLEYNGATMNAPEWWETNYQNAKMSANAEELRKKFAGPGWTSLSSIATPPTR